MLPISLFGRSLSRSAAPTQYSGWGNLPVTLRIQQDYLDISFDGWMLKPIDFKRLYVMLSASQNERVREGLLYDEAIWEKGGWFQDTGKAVTSV